MRQIHILTIFPDMFTGPFDYSIVKRAQSSGLVSIHIHNLRKWSTTNYQSVDDHPFSGGAGMVMLVEPVYKAIKEIKSTLTGITKVLITSAKGQTFTQQKAVSYSETDNLIILCGHYEGIDERVALHIADEEVSIGNYVLSGGELPAMVIVDAITRLLPGAVGNADSLSEESHTIENELEYPHYTRPAVFRTDEGDEWVVPDVLLSGNHKQIQEWKKANTKHI